MRKIQSESKSQVNQKHNAKTPNDDLKDCILFWSYTNKTKQNKEKSNLYHDTVTIDVNYTSSLNIKSQKKETSFCCPLDYVMFTTYHHVRLVPRGPTHNYTSSTQCGRFTLMSLQD